ASRFQHAAFNTWRRRWFSMQLGRLIVARWRSRTPWIAAAVTLGAFALTALSGMLDQREGMRRNRPPKPRIHFSRPFFHFPRRSPA
ncbi:hypothetical protein ACTMU2_02190, partial [Cupriavidus basilensis]